MNNPRVFTMRERQESPLSQPTPFPHFFDDDVPIQEEISFASGCSWLIPKYVINQVGYLNESFFMYAEDSEYCCRVMNAGLKILYCDQSIIYHKIPQSIVFLLVEKIDEITVFFVKNVEFSKCAKSSATLYLRL